MIKETDIERLSQIMLAEFQRVHERFDSIDQWFDAVDSGLSNLASEVATIHRRLDTLEQAVGNVTGFAKEIDHLLKRIAAIEKHLGLSSHIKA